jgi:hypothetical protein
MIVLYAILGFFFILAIPGYFDRHDGEYFVAGSFICLLSTFYIPTIQNIIFEQTTYLILERIFEDLKENIWEPEAFITTYDKILAQIDAVQANAKKHLPYTYGNTIILIAYSSASAYALLSEGTFFDPVGADQPGYLNLCLIGVVFFGFPPLSKVYYGSLINYVYLEITELLVLFNSVVRVLKLRMREVEIRKGWLEKLTYGNKIMKKLETHEINIYGLEQKLKGLVKG